MEVCYKDDWEKAEERMTAWWHGEVLDRPAIQAIAPRADADRDELLHATYPIDIPPDDLFDWFTNPGRVIPRLEKRVASIYWGGEAFPVGFPTSTGMVAITSAFLGCPYRLIGESNTGWSDPIIEDWETRPKFVFDPHNEWWLICKRLLEAAAQRAAGRYYVGIPDLNGPGQILANLRGMERLALDLIDHPEAVKVALAEVTKAWHRYWQSCVGTVHQWVEGYFFWIGIWSDQPATDLQCDFSCLISPQMFGEFFLPSLRQQTEWVERTIYHLDGPDAVRHLDALLSLPKLTAIQWIQGAGAPPVSKWIRLLRRIQAGGKLLQLYCSPGEVETLLAELEPEGLLLITHCNAEEEAKEVLAKAPRWAKRRQWVAP